MKTTLVCALLLSLALLAQGTLRAEEAPTEEMITYLKNALASGQELQKVEEGVRAFSWKNCGSQNDPTVLSALTVSPDPITLGQEITITTKFSLSENIVSGKGYGLSLSIQKSFLGVWIPIPCVDNFGSCNYDLCGILPPNTTACPLKPWGIPCSCPIAANTYTIPAPGFSIVLPNPGIGWLASGDYKLAATLNGPAGRLACYELDLSLAS